MFTNDGQADAYDLKGECSRLPFEREKFLEKLNDSYSYYYDVTHGDDESGLPLVFKAEFHVRDEGYVLVKSAKIWSAESNEYAYFFSLPRFDGETAERCVKYALEMGLPLVQPHKEHRDSYIIAIIVADVITPEAEKVIRGSKFYKSFKFGFEGWVNLQAAAVDLSREVIVTNKVGEHVEKTLKQLLRSEKV